MARLRKSVRRSRKPKMVLECKVKSKSRSLMKKSMKRRRSKSKRRRSKKRKSRSRRRSKKDGCGDGCGNWDNTKDGNGRKALTSNLLTSNKRQRDVDGAPKRRT